MTLTEAKLAAIKGIENFSDEILELNGRAYAFAHTLDFPQIDIDLIAGMLGETGENWRESVRRTVAPAPDSITSG